MGLREQSTVGCFPELVFQFSVAQVLVGLQKQFINNFVLPTWTCAAGFNNNNNNNNNNYQQKYLTYKACRSIYTVVLNFNSVLIVTMLYGTKLYIPQYPCMYGIALPYCICPSVPVRMVLAQHSPVPVQGDPPYHTPSPAICRAQ